jgi:tellurite resistance protein
MSKAFLGERGNSLEESFFAKESEALRRWLRKAEETKTKKDSLSAASGITDDVVLEKLVALNIGSETLAALSLIPLVAVAWADGSIDHKERSIVLSRAEELGLGKQDVSYQLLEGWLAEQPAPALLASWKDYVGALSVTLSREAKEALKFRLLGRAGAIAEAAGGYLGIGQKVSSAEKAVLKELASTLSQ